MRHLSFFVSIGLLLSVTPAHGLRLEWAGGARNLDVTTATRCTLVVTPPPGKSVLPARWRLFWAGEAAVAEPVQVLGDPGPAGSAPLCDFVPAANLEERRSNTSTAGFCGPGDGMPTGSAAYVLLLDPSLEARFAVTPEFGPLVGDPDPWSEVTVNGGSGLAYASELRNVRPLADTLGAPRAGVVGRGLDRVRKVMLARDDSGASDDTLEILSQTATTLTVRTPLELGDDPVLVLSQGEGEPVAALALDGIVDPDPGSSFGPRMVPPYPYEAKDFAFIHANGQYHLFYIRINPTVHDSLSEIDFGHAVSSNLYNWTQLPPVMAVRPGKWDDGHVWAPSIVERDGLYYMFYTGVTKTTTPGGGIQRIGLAISSDLMNWTRFDEPIFSCAGVPWSMCDYGQYVGKQFRDPFVMPDPADATRWLMYYVTLLEVAPDQLIVGAAESPAPDGAWSDLMPLWCTDAFPNNYMGWNESPMLFPRNALWYLFTSTNSGHPIRFKTAPGPLSDSTAWTPSSYRLYDAPGAGGNSDVWIAPEFLRVPGHDYLAVVNRAAVTPGIEIREMIWGTTPWFSLTPPAVTAVEPRPAAGVFSFAVGSPVGHPRGLEFRAELPRAGHARLDIFDVGGRRVARVLDAWVPSGPSVHRWNGRTDAGGTAESGVYFALMSALDDSRSLRVVHVR